MIKRAKSKPGSDYLFGVNPILEELLAKKRFFQKIVIRKGARSKDIDRIARLAKEAKFPVELAPAARFGSMLPRAHSTQGVIGFTSPPGYLKLDALIRKLSTPPPPEKSRRAPARFIVALDGVTDEGNFGAIIRSAEAFGAMGLIFAKSQTASYSAVAAKSSAGAGAWLDLCVVESLAGALDRLKKIDWRLVALDQSGSKKPLRARKTKNDALCPPGTALILGDEGKGIRPSILKMSHDRIAFPMRGRVGSLNVSAAAAIGAYLVSALQND